MLYVAAGAVVVGCLEIYRGFKMDCWSDDERHLINQIQLVQEMSRDRLNKAQGNPAYLAAVIQSHQDENGMFGPNQDVWFYGDIPLRQAVRELSSIQAKKEWVESRPYLPSNWFRTYVLGVPSYKVPQTLFVEDILDIPGG
jgi:hypothetical protein